VSRLGQGVRLAGAYVPEAGSTQATRDDTVGTRRARALTLLLLALPGAAYLYNGQELGLPNVDDLPEEALQDPIWERSGRTSRGRDGCRIPMPWTSERPNLGFTDPTARPWLPIPPTWAGISVAAQRRDASSMLALHRDALRLRRASRALGSGALEWAETGRADVLALDLVVPGERVRVVVALSDQPVALPEGSVLLTSEPLTSEPLAGGRLPGTAAAWVRLA